MCVAHNRTPAPPLDVVTMNGWTFINDRKESPPAEACRGGQEMIFVGPIMEGKTI
jgi:hypothetical protein